jgi:hypothetical protein
LAKSRRFLATASIAQQAVIFAADGASDTPQGGDQDGYLTRFDFLYRPGCKIGFLCQLLLGKAGLSTLLLDAAPDRDEPRIASG